MLCERKVVYITNKKKKFIGHLHTYLTFASRRLGGNKQGGGRVAADALLSLLPPEQDTKSWHLLNEGDPLSVFSLNFAGYLTVTTKAKPKQF